MDIVDMKIDDSEIKTGTPLMWDGEKIVAAKGNCHAFGVAINDSTIKINDNGEEEHWCHVGLVAHYENSDLEPPTSKPTLWQRIKRYIHNITEE